MDCHINWDTAARLRSAVPVNHVQGIMSFGQDTLPSFAKQDLREKQHRDADLARVLHYVEWDGRPSRRERPNEPVNVLLLRQWYKLAVMDSILYRVSKAPGTGKKRYQYVVPVRGS